MPSVERDQRQEIEDRQARADDTHNVQNKRKPDCDGEFNNKKDADQAGHAFLG